MKLICFIMLVVLVHLGLYSAAQSRVQSIEATASGLTCSMCSKAIYKAISRLSFVLKVDVNIQNSTYTIIPKKDAVFQIGQVQQAIQNAGFSVASLQVVINFVPTSVTAGNSITIQGNRFIFLRTKNQTIQGQRALAVKDKDYVPPTTYRQYQQEIKNEEGGSVTEPVYHVTLL